LDFRHPEDHESSGVIDNKKSERQIRLPTSLDARFADPALSRRSRSEQTFQKWGSELLYDSSVCGWNLNDDHLPEHQQTNENGRGVLKRFAYSSPMPQQRRRTEPENRKRARSIVSFASRNQTLPRIGYFFKRLSFASSEPPGLFSSPLLVPCSLSMLA
jgi:hypothetical protein